MKRLSSGLLFFVGWLLSPLTWWNDAFINIPLSYLMANLLFYTTHLSFMWLVLGSYWFTNVLGIFFMYFSGRHLILSAKNRIKAAIFLTAFLIIYSVIMIHLDKQGRLLPFGAFFEKYCIVKYK